MIASFRGGRADAALITLGVTSLRQIAVIAPWRLRPIAVLAQLSLYRSLHAALTPALVPQRRLKGLEAQRQ
jgi:hypothetical protein